MARPPAGRVDSEQTGDTWRALRLMAEILALCQRPHEIAELAECFGVSTNTIRRDLAALGGGPLYVPLQEDRGRWWVL